MTETKRVRPEVPPTHAGLLEAPVGVLATLGRDGFPQVTAVWFLWDQGEGVLRMSLNTARQKVKNLRKWPEASFLIMDPATPYKTLELRGRVEMEMDEAYQFAEQVGKKYGGVNFWAGDAPGDKRLKVTLRPVKVNTWGE